MHGFSLVTWGVAGLIGAMVIGPGVAHGGPEDGPPVPRATSCETVLEEDPGWELRQETDPADGSEVHPGDGVAVLMTWDETDFADRPLFNTLACVTVDGRLDPALSLVEDDPPNDGEFTHNFTVPDVAAGTEVCSRGAVVGDGKGYFELNPSDDVCFSVAEGGPHVSPQVSPGTEIPPAPASPEPTRSPSVASPALAAAPAPAPGPEVAGAVAEQPAPAPGPAPEVGAVEGHTLPRTGNSPRPVIVPAGLLLTLGGAALIGAVKRPARGRRD